MTNGSNCQRNCAEFLAVTATAKVKLNASANLDRNTSEEGHDGIQAGRLSGTSLVVAEQAAESRITNDSLARRERVVGFDPLPGQRPIA